MFRFLLAFVWLALALQSHAGELADLAYKLKASVVRVRVSLPEGRYGIGSGVVIGKEQVVTNCHVIANASAIGVIKSGESYRASAVKADWAHDLCIVKFDSFDIAAVTIGSSKNLQYEQPVFSISFPNNAPKPQTVYGAVKALYPMDGSFIIRTSNDFRMGASGGPVFDNDGKLIGIITLKSPGRNAYYYNIPVEWIQAALNQPEQPLPAVGSAPFWDAPEENRPYFMRVIQPYQTEDWKALLAIATEWTDKQPDVTEALFYKAVAQYHLKDTQSAERLFKQIYAQNSRHSGALMYLGLIAAESGNTDEARKNIALLNTLDMEAAERINVALGKPSKPADTECTATC